MGERGPRPDPAQAAKGYPGRRKSKAVKASESAERLAGLLAPNLGAVADLPALLQDAKYQPAAALWRRLAPELRKTHRLPLEAEFYFAQACIYAQEWLGATEDLHLNGFSQSIKTVAGGRMERRRPMILDRQQAFQNLMELSARFGLTPGDMYALFKGQAAAASVRPDLFTQERKGQAPVAEPETPSLVGSFGAARSTPPPRLDS